MRLLIALVATAALLVGCGGSDEPDESTDAATEASESPSGPQSFTSVEQLRDAAVEAGYDCPSWQQDDAVTLAAESGNCSDSDVFATFASEGDLQQQLETDRELDDMLSDAGVEPDPALVGPNWMITGPEAPTLADALGGTVSR